MLCERKACVYFLSLLQATESAIHFRVRLEDVHCESTEVIFSQVQQLNKKLVSKEKYQKEKQKVQF